MKHIQIAIASLLILAGLLVPATGQVPNFPQTVAPNTVVGRLGVTAGPTQAIPISTLGGFFNTSTSVTGSGAKCDGATDDTTAINAALARGGWWTIPAGKTCAVTQLNFTVSGTRLSGAHFNTSILKGTTNSAPTINVSASLSNIYIDNLQLTKQGTASSGGTGIKMNGDCQYCVIDSVFVQKHYVGIAVQSAGISYMRHVLSQQNLHDGITFTNSAVSGTVQWDLDDVFSGQNAGRGFLVASGSGSGGVTLGSWHNVRTFANTGAGAAFVGTATYPVNGVRITKGFIGQDNSHGIFLDTYGGLHTITDTYVELSATGPSGPTLATPASHSGDGIRITANNLDVAVTTSYINGNYDSGINTSATVITGVTSTHISNHGLYGILSANCTLLHGAGNYFLTNTSGNISCTTNSGSQVISGSVPNTLNSGLKVINTNTSFYVTTSGNDANGCTNNTTDACLTFQRAYDNLVDNYAIQGKTTVVTINVGNGTYTDGLITSRCVVGQNGPASVKILGSATPSNVVVSVTSKDAFGFGETSTGNGTNGCTQITIGGMKLVTTTSGNAINVSGGGVGITFGSPGFPIEFGAAAQDHIVANHSGWVIAGAAYTISGSALIHAAAISNSTVAIHNVTATLSGTPAFTYFGYADTNGALFASGMTFVGSATGTRYFAGNGGAIYTNGSATYLPGNATGVEYIGGKYIGSTGPTGLLLYTAGVNTYVSSSTAGQTIVQGASAPAFANPAMLVSCVRSVNFNSANTDNAITVTSPSTNWVLFRVYIANASASISTATLGVFSSTGGGGTALLANSAITVTTASANTANNMQAISVGSTTQSYNFATVQARVGTAQGSAATADVCLVYMTL